VTENALLCAYYLHARFTMRIRATGWVVRVMQSSQRRLPASMSTHAISASVLIQSFGSVALCFAARSGSIAPTSMIRPKLDLKPSNLYSENRSRSLDQRAV